MCAGNREMLCNCSWERYTVWAYVCGGSCCVGVFVCARSGYMLHVYVCFERVYWFGNLYADGRLCVRLWQGEGGGNKRNDQYGMRLCTTLIRPNIL